MTLRSARRLVQRSVRVLRQSAAAELSSTGLLQRQVPAAGSADSHISSAELQPCTRGFAAEASPPKIDKPSGEETGLDSPYNKPKEGAEAEGKGTEIPWDPEHVNIGNECDKILLHSAEKEGIPGILKEIETHGMTFNDNNIATAFEQLALYKGDLSQDDLQKEVFDTAGFKSLVKMATEETDNFLPRQLADITASLGKLQFQDASLLASLLSRTASKISDMDPEHLKKLSDGLAGSTAAGLKDLYKSISSKT